MKKSNLARIRTIRLTEAEVLLLLRALANARGLVDAIEVLLKKLGGAK